MKTKKCVSPLYLYPLRARPRCRIEQRYCPRISLLKSELWMWVIFGACCMSSGLLAARVGDYGTTTTMRASSGRCPVSEVDLLEYAFDLGHQRTSSRPQRSNTQQSSDANMVTSIPRLKSEIRTRGCHYNTVLRVLNRAVGGLE